MKDLLATPEPPIHTPEWEAWLLSGLDGLPFVAPDLPSAKADNPDCGITYSSLSESLPVMDGPDSLERVKEDLASLPPLPWWQVKPYLEGGWHEFAQKPKTVEWFKESTGNTNPKGQTIYRNRVRILDSKMPVERSSREQTLSTIRAMRKAGYSKEQAFWMMNRGPAVGTDWLWDQSDPEAEFLRCWDKAELPTKYLDPRKFKSAEKGHNGFVSRQSDRDLIFAFIEANPGLGTRALIRSGCGLTGSHPDGRIKAGLMVLRDQGRVRTEPGPRRAVLHFVEVSQVVSVVSSSELDALLGVEAGSDDIAI